MSWEKETEEITLIAQRAKAQGGTQALKAQHAKGRLSVRERIDRILDPNSFQEHGRLVGSATRDENGQLTDFSPANYVTGLGKIENQLVAVGGEDFTLKGGSPNAAGLRKSVYSEELALQYKVPLVRLLEGGGGSVSSGKGNQGPVGSPVYEKPRFQSIAKIL